MLFKIAEHTVM